MNEDGLKWAAVVLLMGLPALVVLGYRKGVYSGEGVRHQDKNLYSFALSLLFLGASLFVFQLDMATALKAGLFGLALSTLEIYRLRRLYDTRIVDDAYVIPARVFKYRYLYGGAVALAAVLVFQSPLGAELIAAVWPVMGPVIAFVASSVYQCLYTARIEHRIGRPIVERIGA